MIKKGFVCFIWILLANLAKRQAQGPNVPYSAISIPGQGSLWTNAINIQMQDQHYPAIQNFDAGSWSAILLANDFRFNISPDQKIEGIEVNILRSASGNNQCIRDTLIVLSKSSIQPAGDNKARPQYWSATDTSISYGGPSDLWGASWTPENINSTNFGVMISLYKEALCTGQDNPQIDQVTVKIYTSPIVNFKPYDIISPYLNTDAARFKIVDSGKAKVLDKGGALIKSFPIPGEWDGTNQEGAIVPVGVYYIIINERKETSVTVVY